MYESLIASAAEVTIYLSGQLLIGFGWNEAQQAGGAVPGKTGRKERLCGSLCAQQSICHSFRKR